MTVAAVKLDRSAVERARSDPGAFAEVLIGEPLWPHQLDVVRSPARIRCICSGRQAGKSRTLAVLALHRAFTLPGALVLLLSAGEDAAKDLLGEVAALAAAPLLGGSVVDEGKSQVTLSNASTIRSVPASERQVRGKAVDLLILDEAAFIDETIWRAARYTVIARPGSRVVMASTPFGRRDRFFSVHYRAGLRWVEGEHDGVSVAGFHWPSTASPLVDRELLETWKATSTDREYRAEVLAEWVAAAGAYFTADELEASVADYELVAPARARGQLVAGGVDWGLSRDANTLALIGALEDGTLNAGLHPELPVFFVAHLDEQFGMPYATFVDRVVDVADRDRGGFYVRVLASETNGVGAYPTEDLRAKLHRRHTGTGVAGVHTDARRKESAFGALKMLLQQRRMVLPRHPGLLRQLESTEFETLESGLVRIAVPERSGHDDLVMALAQATACLRPMRRAPAARGWVPEVEDVVATSGGVTLPLQPRCLDDPHAFGWPRSNDETGDW